MIARVRIVLALATVIAGCGDDAADDETGRAATSTIDAYSSSHGGLGISAAIVRADRSVWTGGAGLADRESGRLVDADTVFLTGSVTKSVIGIAAMALVEDGLLDLDADIASKLPFVLADPFGSGPPRTVRQLLAHTASISDAHYATIFDQFYATDVDPSVTLGDFVRGMLAVDGAYYADASFVSAAPGTAYEYTNVGYALLGHVLERAAGEPLDGYVARRVLEPLGMVHASLRLADIPPALRAMPYADDGTPLGHFTFADYPSGSLRASASDVGEALRMVLGRGEVDGNQVLTEASATELVRVPFPTVPGAVDQAHGWDRRVIAGRTFWGHVGEEAGTATAAYFDPQTGVGVVILTNRGLANQAEDLPGLFLDLVDLGAVEQAAP